MHAAKILKTNMGIEQFNCNGKKFNDDSKLWSQENSLVELGKDEKPSEKSNKNRLTSILLSNVYRTPMSVKVRSLKTSQNFRMYTAANI